MTSPPERVAYILHRFPHQTETFIAGEMSWIRRHGIEVDVFSLMAPKHPAGADSDLVDRTHYLPGFGATVLRAHAQFLRSRPGSYVRALVRLIRHSYREPRVLALALGLFPKMVAFAAMIDERRIRHVHAHFVWLEGLAAGVVRDLVGTSFTLHPHAFGLFGRNQRSVRAQLEHASHVVAISDYHQRYIAAVAPRVAGVTLVHCGVPSEDFQPALRREASDRPRILSVGRAVEKKGHRHLVDACAALRDRGVRFRLSIVLGPGGNAAELQARIDGLGLRSSVELVGAQDRAQLLRRYQGADVFALACVVASDGDRDGIPVALMEAMACEVPVVTTPVAGIPDLVRQEETGVLVPPGDAAALADALERLLADAELRHRLGKRGRRAIESGFEVRETAAQMADLFRRAVAEAASGP